MTRTEVRAPHRTYTATATPRSRSWRMLGTRLALGLGLFGLYMANGRDIGSGDVVPATYTSVALVRGDGPWVDRFARVLRTADGRLPGYVAESRGHIVGCYPVGPGLIAAPLMAPQVWLLDRTRPGWESETGTVRLRCMRMAKTSAAALSAMALVAFHVLLVRLGLGRVALPTCLVVALGSGFWPMASQALWQHGPAALCLTVALLGLIPPSCGRHGHEDVAVAPGSRRLGHAVAGAATALMVACRPIDAVFAAAIGLWVLVHGRRAERWAFVVPALVLGAALAVFNVWFFDTLTGGYAKIEAMHPWAHGTHGTFTGSLREGGLGTLLSPSHGLFVYSPWVAVALGALLAPPVRRRFPRSSLPAWLLVSLVPNFVLLATYSCWWGGHSFGPRFWIDAMPILGLLFAQALDWALSGRHRAWLAALVASAFLAIVVHGIGFLCYPSTWHNRPSNADRDHARLWDWRDSELTRGLREGIRPALW
jgi:hypothetical protein